MSKIWHSIKERFIVWKEIFTGCAWKWVVTIFSLYGVFQFIRDEILSAEIQERLYIRKMLPDIHWETYFILILIISIILILEGSYKAVTKRQKIIDEFFNVHFELSINKVEHVFIESTKQFLSLDVSIANKGSPSIAKDWSLSVKSDNFNLKQAKFERSSKLTSKLFTVRDLEKDALEDKTENKEVIGKVRGTLIFSLENIKEEDMDDKIILVLSVKDKCGRTYHSKKKAIKEINRGNY